jgi:hypothetical protein
MASTPVVRIFRHPSEAEARPEFSLDCEITEQNFSHIIGPTRFTKDTKVRCQIRQPDNHYRCKQEHWNGWVAANGRGEEGYIGSVCGDRDLNSSERYRLEKKRVNAEVRLIEFLEILDDLLADLNDKSEIRADVAALVLAQQGRTNASKNDCKLFAEDYYAALRAAQKNDGMRLL